VFELSVNVFVLRKQNKTKKKKRILTNGVIIFRNIVYVYITVTNKPAPASRFEILTLLEKSNSETLKKCKSFQCLKHPIEGRKKKSFKIKRKGHSILRSKNERKKKSKSNP
jgi:hypothetical protein